MGGYYDYTDEFRELITNTNTIIENQEVITNQLIGIENSLNVLLFTTVLVFSVSIARKIFREK